MKFGILLNGYEVQSWQRSVVERLLQEGHTCSLVVMHDQPPDRRTFLTWLRHYPYRFILYRIYWRFFMKTPSFRPANLEEIIPNIEEVRSGTIRQGSAMYFRDDDLARIRSFGVDFLLRFGFSIIKGGILESAKYGVWSYHHDDPERYRGVPTGFHEILQHDPVNGAILQRLGDRVDGGEILHKGYFRTTFHSWKGNLNHLLQSTIDWPALVCRKITLQGFAAVQERVPQPGRLYKLPGNLLMARFLFLVLANRIKFNIRRLLRHERWFTVVCRCTPETLFQSGTTVLPEPALLIRGSSSSSYHADPFGLVLEDGVHIFTEKYCYRRKKGILVAHVYDLDLRRRKRSHTVLELAGHLAYPFLFQYGDTVYCLPENADGGHVDLYRYDPMHGTLEFCRRLISGLEAIDGTLLYHEERWYYFFTDRQSTNERLHIWHAEQLEGPYEPHLLNPVKTDIRSARPAGRPFYHDGRLLRPTQNCSLRSGWKINIQEIKALSPTLFSETDFTEVMPPRYQGKMMKGIHTFSVDNGFCIADMKTEVFIFSAFVSSMIQMGKRIFGRLMP